MQRPWKNQRPVIKKGFILIIITVVAGSLEVDMHCHTTSAGILHGAWGSSQPNQVSGEMLDKHVSKVCLTPNLGGRGCLLLFRGHRPFKEVYLEIKGLNIYF